MVLLEGIIYPRDGLRRDQHYTRDDQHGAVQDGHRRHQTLLGYNQVVRQVDRGLHPLQDASRLTSSEPRERVEPCSEDKPCPSRVFRGLQILICSLLVSWRMVERATDII